MDVDQFIVEHWKVYETYMQRKEHLIEVTTTLYLAFVAALLSRDDQFWTTHVLSGLTLWLATAVLVWIFVRWQFGLWSEGARICNSCQTLMTRSLANPVRSDVDAVAGSHGVELPKVLSDEIQKRRERWDKLGCWERIKALRFELVVYALGFVWSLALLFRVSHIWRREVDMGKVVDASAVGAMLVAGICLYLASLPISGAITFVGGGKTEEEIKRADRRRKWQSRVGLALLIVGSVVQVLRLIGVLH